MPHKIKKFRLAPGEFYVFKCLDCGQENGGGILNEWNVRQALESDQYCPINRPCVWCGKGPVVIQMTGEMSDEREI